MKARQKVTWNIYICIAQKTPFICIDLYIRHTGLGLYLHKIDPSRTVTEHLEHIYQTCVVHYNRLVITTLSRC